MRDELSIVLENRYLSGRLYLLKLHAPHIAKRAKAGQFVMMRVAECLEPLGRRAFAVGDVRGESILIFYDLVGRGTQILSGVKRGERLQVLGPLGKGLFNTDGERHLLIGGGVGLAGLSLLGKELRKLGRQVLFVYGGRSAEHLGMESWLKEEGFDYVLFTEDGSKGRKGLVTDVLGEFDTSWVVHACGPEGMLKAIKNRKSGHKVYLSLESRMACGWGVCLGCVIKTPQGYKRVCYEGPVFEAEEVLF